MSSTAPRPPKHMMDLSYYGDFTLQHLAELGLQRVDLDELVEPDAFMQDCINAKAQLTTLRMGIYQDAAGNVLLGSMDERLHPHDRWFLHAPLMPEAERAWYEIRHHAHLAGKDDQTIMLTKPSPIRDLSLELTAVITTAERIKLQDRLSDLWRVYHVATRVGQAILELLEKTEDPGPDMHDLIFHYSAWAANNPEFAELPAHIVRRMHGLGEVITRAEAVGASPYGEVYNVDLSEL
jgi:hypothetical protein